MTTRGMVWRKYVADDATEYATLVDADQAAITARGWSTVAGGTAPLPRGARERRVHGISLTTGRKGTARVGTATCDLWTGTATTFTVEADDQTTDTMTVTRRQGERIRLST
jgi:hypothetical protein